MKTLDKIILLIAILLIAFIVTMIIIFCIKDAIPDTLVMCVLGTGMGELVMTSIITITKKKYNIKENEDEITE